MGEMEVVVATLVFKMRGFQTAIAMTSRGKSPGRPKNGNVGAGPAAGPAAGPDARSLRKQGTITALLVFFVVMPNFWYVDLLHQQIAALKGYTPVNCSKAPPVNCSEAPPVNCSKAPSDKPQTPDPETQAFKDLLIEHRSSIVECMNSAVTKNDELDKVDEYSISVLNELDSRTKKFDQVDDSSVPKVQSELIVWLKSELSETFSMLNFALMTNQKLSDALRTKREIESKSMDCMPKILNAIKDEMKKTTPTFFKILFVNEGE